jgi:hypothetical protein
VIVVVDSTDRARAAIAKVFLPCPSPRLMLLALVSACSRREGQIPLTREDSTQHNDQRPSRALAAHAHSCAGWAACSSWGLMQWVPASL